MRLLIVGATGGSGRAAVAAALEAGHAVTAFSRRASEIASRCPRLRKLDGDVLDPDALARAVHGQDAVIVTLGITEHPVRVRLRGSRGTPLDVRSRGIASVVAAMQQHGVRRLVVQSSYGVGETRQCVGLQERLVFALLLKPHIDDHERQEAIVRASGLDWTIVQPVNLTDDTVLSLPFASTEAETRGMKVARSSVGRYLVHAVEDDTTIGRSVALSGRAAAR